MPAFWFSLISWLLVVLVVGRAFFSRGLPYAIFSTMVLGLLTASTTLLFPLLGPAKWLMIPLQIVTLLHFLLLTKPRLRPLAYRALVSVPGSWYSAGALLALPWALAAGMGFEPWAPWLPWLIALPGVVTSLRTQVEDLELVLDGRPVPELARIDPGVQRTPRSLSVVQITDPHLGPFMSVERLAAICQRAVERRPDLVVLTGDYLTMESNNTPRALAKALEPLKQARGQVFAIFGNHDHEAPDEVRAAMMANGIRLLVDESVVVETGAGRVQLVGADHRWTQRDHHLRELVEAHPRIPETLRLVLLHDPSSFPYLPDGEADLVLSGHTHGGQLGLLSLGLEWTFLTSFKGMPDHGFWGLGRNRLYVHKGTGHYGYPLRLGVPAEESVLRIHQLAGA